MKLRRVRCLPVFGVMLAAGMLLPGVTSAGPEQGLKHYAAHEFDQAIEVCKGEKDFMSRLVVAFSYTERYNIYKQKPDKEQATMYFKLLSADVTLDHAKTIEKFLEVPGNPNGNKAAVKLLKKSFEKAKTVPEHVLLMTKFLDPAKGVEVNKTALSAISKRLKPVRDYVSKGGNMPKEMQPLFASRELIMPLILSLSEKKTASLARKCLVQIEEPALKFLEAEGQELTKPVSDAILAVKKAIASRLKKHPNSTWCSAYGE